METIQPLDTQQLLSEAIEAAHKWEGDLGPKGKKGKGEQALEALKKGKLEVQNPQAYLERLRAKDFADLGIPLSPAIQKSMSGANGYAYYRLAAPVLLYPGRGAQYRLLEGQLAFEVAHGQREVGIYSIFPKAEWKPVIDWGGSLRLGLDGNLEWAAGVDQTEVKIGKLGGALSGRVKNINQISSFIQVMPFVYTLGRMEIEATYTAQTAIWRLDGKSAVRDQGQIQLVVLLKVPVELGEMRLAAAVQAEPDFDWLTAQVEHIQERLPQALREIFRKKRGLPLQAFEKWTLNLSK